MQYFLNEFGNFDNFVKIWTRRPPNYYQNALTNTRKYGIIQGKYYLCQYGTHFFENVRRMYVLGTMFTFCFSLRFSFCENVSTYFEKYLYGDEDRKMINFPLVKCTKAWM